MLYTLIFSTFFCWSWGPGLYKVAQSFHIMRKQHLFICFFVIAAFLLTAASDHKPRRGRHYIPAHKVGSVETEELGEEIVQEKDSFIGEVKGDGRLSEWSNWWHACERSFAIGDFVDAGIVSIAGEWKPFDRKSIEGPNKEFLARRGGKAINPVWGRMKYVRVGKVWQAETSPRCGVILYEGNRARKVIHCGELDGTFKAFWVDKSRFYVTAYRKISPEMSAECKAKEVGECVAAILWLVDLADSTVWEYRGPVVTFSKCEPNDYLVKLYPEFYVQDVATKKSSK